MVIDKQKRTMECIASGRYKAEQGEVFVLKSNGWHRLSPTLLPSGYKQLHICNHKRNEARVSVRVYLHIFVYMLHNGMYEDGLMIDHIDGDNTNNRIENLRAVTQRQNINPAKTYKTKAKGNFQTNPIRSEGIKAIRELMEQGYSQAHIARILGYNRLSVRYTYNNIKAGKKLKYEEA